MFSCDYEIYQMKNSNIFFYLRNLIDKSKENKIQKFFTNCDSKDNCPISQDTPINPVKLNCEHIFDKENIIIWLKKNNSCPVCRNTFFL